jgi:hypothetical protein
MKNKSFYIVLSAGLIIATILAGIFWRASTSDQNGNVPAKSDASLKFLDEITLSKEVEAVLDKKILLIQGLVADPTIISEVKKTNQANEGLSLPHILELDQRWRKSEGEDSFVAPFFANAVAVKLKEFQKSNLGFREIFVTDTHGLNVGQTNKTTDYYQADEEWWIRAYNSGEGKSYHGLVEFDESAQTEAISLYVPIRDPDMASVIGVAKVVLSITAIKAEL